MHQSSVHACVVIEHTPAGVGDGGGVGVGVVGGVEGGAGLVAGVEAGVELAPVMRAHTSTHAREGQELIIIQY